MWNARMTWTTLDTWIVITGMLAAGACALPGCYLVLRRLSLMGDAISHAVLPGLAVAFLLTGSRASWPMFIGAGVVGILTAALAQWVERLGKVEASASLGIVFTTLFAIGLIMIRFAADNVDLDVDCVLYGAIEMTPLNTVQPFGTTAEMLGIGVGTEMRPLVMTRLLGWQVPQAAVVNAAMLCVNIGFIAFFYKELKISAFDPQLATTLGINAQAMHYALMVFVALAAVASFEAVGSILVIAMLICPAATARMLTDRLGSQIAVSVVAALIASVGGYFLGAFAPAWLPIDHSLSAAGMMTVVAGTLMGLAIVGAPRHGVVARQVRRLRLAASVAREDLLAMLWRLEEAAPMAGRNADMPARNAIEALGGGVAVRLAVRSAIGRRLATRENEALRLTGKGRTQARSLVRTHRLWETYLVRTMGLRQDHVHRTAMDLEHVTDDWMREELAGDQPAPARDPHGRTIPPAPPVAGDQRRP